MAFGGYFNPNYTLLPHQQGQSPQLPPSPQPGPMQPPPQPQNARPTFSDMFSMPFMSMPFMQYYGGGMPANPAPTTAPQVPQLPTTPTPVNKPGGTTTPPPPTTHIPNSGVYGQPGQYAAPNPGGDPRYAVPTPPPAQSGQQAYDQELAYYNSPEYSAYYNSLAPSTRAYMHAPGNSATGTYLANSARQNWEGWHGNPWTRPPGG